jgi:hypothetical protein
MTEQTQIDPPWRVALRLSVKDAAWKADPGTFNITVVAGLEDAILAAVLPHMETSYRVGRMAGASASAKRLAQKNLELAKKLREVREAINYDEGATYSLERVVDILGDES